MPIPNTIRRGVLIVCLIGQTSIPAAAQEPTVAVVDGRAISTAELDRLVGDRLLRLRTEEYALKLAALHERIDQLLLAREAERRGISTAQLLKAEVSDRIPPVTEAEAQAVIETMPRLPELPAGADAVRTAMDDILRRRTAKRQSEFLALLRRKYAMEIKLEPPRLTRSIPGGQTIGPDSAPITIAVFSDFQCPYCTTLEASLQRLRAEFGSQLRVIAKQFPLPSYPQAMKAAEAALCAAEQSGYWRMQDLLFTNQGLVSGQQFNELAKRAGLDLAHFESCMNSRRSAASVGRDVADGRVLGLNSTPTLFVNGLMVIGAKPYEGLREMVQSELNRSTQPATRAGTPKD